MSLAAAKDWCRLPRRWLASGRSRPFTPREAALDLRHDRHQLSYAVDDVMRAGRRQLLRRRGAASGEILRCQGLRVRKRQAEDIAGHGDADGPRARIEAFADSDFG